MRLKPRFLMNLMARVAYMQSSNKRQKTKAHDESSCEMFFAFHHHDFAKGKHKPAIVPKAWENKSVKTTCRCQYDLQMPLH
jgi:hypothetical protein